VESFTMDIVNGHWDTVLKTVSVLKIPQKKTIDLYEQVNFQFIKGYYIKFLNLISFYIAI